MKTYWTLLDHEAKTIHISHDADRLRRFRRQEGIAGGLFPIVGSTTMVRNELRQRQRDGYVFAAFPDVDAASVGLRVVSQ